MPLATCGGGRRPRIRGGDSGVDPTLDAQRDESHPLSSVDAAGQRRIPAQGRSVLRRRLIGVPDQRDAERLRGVIAVDLHGHQAMSIALIRRAARRRREQQSAVLHHMRHGFRLPTVHHVRRDTDVRVGEPLPALALAQPPAPHTASPRGSGPLRRRHAESVACTELVLRVEGPANDDPRTRGRLRREDLRPGSRAHDRSR